MFYLLYFPKSWITKPGGVQARSHLAEKMFPHVNAGAILCGKAIRGGLTGKRPLCEVSLRYMLGLITEG